MKDNLKSKVIIGVIWRTIEQFGVQIVNFGVAIILARLLGPEAFGTIALLTIFIALSEVIANAGFGQALIQKKDADDLDFNSVFYFSCAVGVLLYVILFCAAPLVAKFYDIPLLKILLRVLAIRVVLDMIGSIQNSYLSRNMLFKKSFFIAFPSTVLSGVVGIWLAYSNFGVWSLVWSSLSGCFLNLILRWYIIGWRPSLAFSFDRLRVLWGFGSKILVSGFLDTFFTQLYSIIIGKVYTPKDLAFYAKGDNMPRIGMNCIQGAISSVVFPAFSQIQNDKSKLKEAMHKTMRVASIIVFPMMVGLAIMSKPIILLLLGDEWIAVVPFMQMACVIYAFWPIHVISLQAIQAVGRSDIFLKLEIYKKGLALFVLLITFRSGVFMIALGRLLTTPLSVFINIYPNIKLIGYSFKNLFIDLHKSIIISVLFLIIGVLTTYFNLHTMVLLAVQIFAFIVVYFISIYFLSPDLLIYIKQCFAKKDNK